MAYVHGHPRDLGWVVAHHRRPHRPGVGQLRFALLVCESGALEPPVVGVPAPREPVGTPVTSRP